MEDSLFSGDLILIRKNHNKHRKILESVFGSRRKIPSGATKFISRNSLVVLQDDNSNYYVKRCVGIPGDTISFKDRELIINNRFSRCDIPTFRACYRFYSENLYRFLSLADSLHLLGKVLYQKAPSSRDLILNTKDFNSLNNGEYIDSVQTVNYRDFDTNSFYFQMSRSINKNQETIFIIPYKGFSVKIEHNNLFFYEKILTKYENIYYIEMSNGEMCEYIFKNNYYYFVGDNSPFSIDSRDWGLISEEMVCGKTIFVFHIYFKYIIMSFLKLHFLCI